LFTPKAREVFSGIIQLLNRCQCASGPIWRFITSPPRTEGQVFLLKQTAKKVFYSLKKIIYTSNPRYLKEGLGGSQFKAILG
jgi:hypothetical protein